VLSQVPVLTAAVGVIGTLIGAGVTQIASSRREATQWKRQMAQERERWDRERQERQEQWDREDAARWERDRYSAYSEVLASIERWIDLVRSIKPYPVTRRRCFITTEGVAQLDEARESIERGAMSIELLAPESIREKVRGISVSTSCFALRFAPPSTIDETLDEDEGECDVALDRIVRASWALRDAVRRDLGIEPSADLPALEAGDDDSTSDNSRQTPSG